MVVGGFLFFFLELRNSYHFINKSVRKIENFLGISRQSLRISVPATAIWMSLNSLVIV